MTTGMYTVVDGASALSCILQNPQDIPWIFLFGSFVLILSRSLRFCSSCQNQFYKGSQPQVPKERIKKQKQIGITDKAKQKAYGK